MRTYANVANPPAGRAGNSPKNIRIIRVHSCFSVMLLNNKQFFRYILIGTLSFLSFSPQVFSQLSTHIHVFPATAHLVSQETVEVSIKNVGSTPYTGPITTYYTDSLNNFLPVLLCGITQTTLNPGDSVPCSSLIYIDSTHFHVGPNNIVVVWSSGNARLAADSVWKKINILPLGAGINETNEYSGISVYPSPAKDFILVEFKESVLAPKIYISDPLGRVISTASFIPDGKNRIRINTSELNNGIYFLDILLPDKQRMVSKFVKAE